jgi:DNA polymerase III epsilon subunit-like protein
MARVRRVSHPLQEHQLLATHGQAYKCAVCLHEWRYRPSWACPGFPLYAWGAAPEHLKTEAELKKMRLEIPPSPAGCIWWGSEKRYIYLYDSTTATPKPELTSAQIAGKERAALTRRTCKGCGEVKSRPGELSKGRLCRACRRTKFAAELRALVEAGNVVVLDTETTGLEWDDQVIELAIVDLQGNALLDTRIRTLVPIEDGARAVHGISNQDLAAAPSFPEIWPRLAQVWRGKTVAVFNAEFDERLLEQTRYAHDIKMAKEERPSDWLCLMYTAQEHLEWEYRPSLRDACQKFGVKPGDHSALADARAALGVLLAMAEGKKVKG